MHLQGSVGRTGLMMGLRSNLSTDMPTKEASASQEASVAAKRVQLVELSYMGQGNELDTLCACRLRVSPIQSVSQSSIHHSLLQECSTHLCASTQAPEQSGSKGKAHDAAVDGSRHSAWQQAVATHLEHASQILEVRRGCQRIIKGAEDAWCSWRVHTHSWGRGRGLPSRRYTNSD